MGSARPHSAASHVTLQGRAVDGGTLESLEV
jgi:hypothetical protein